MTYPPQQPGQHGPYGQPQPGQGMPPGGNPQPPGNQRKTGVIVGITLTLLLIAGAAVAITGFWQPGYFLSEDTASAEQSDTGSGSTPENGQPPKPPLETEPGGEQQGGSEDDVTAVHAIAEDAATAINDRDEELARQISCESNEDPDFSKAPDDARAEVAGDPVIEGDSASVPFRLTANGETRDLQLPAKRQNGAWCLG